MTHFGEFIRTQRVSKGLLLREIAAEVQVDPSLLSRIERGKKRPTRNLVIALASVLKIDQDALLIHYLSDRVVYALKDETLAMKAIEVAESKIIYKQEKNKDTRKREGLIPTRKSKR